MLKSREEQRDNLTELNKERPVQGPPVPIDVGSDKGKFKLDKEGFLGGLDVGDLGCHCDSRWFTIIKCCKKSCKRWCKRWILWYSWLHS